MGRNPPARIVAVTAPPTRAGRLAARYDTEALLLVLESPVERPRPLGFNVEGRVLFDCDDAGVLAQVVINIRRELWRPGLAQQWPTDPPEADVVVDASVRNSTVPGPVECLCDAARERVLVRWSDTTAARAVALATNVLALVDDAALLGLFVRDPLDVHPSAGEDIIPAQIF